MPLVDYSDSESETETSIQKSWEVAKPPSTDPTFHKAASGKIKVELPSIRPEPGSGGDLGPDVPLAKRARTGGAFSGFNSLLPAPKKTGQSAPKKGISLKTSSEAAFARQPLSEQTVKAEETTTAATDDDATAADAPLASIGEPKLIGKATRFLPLSVTNKKRKKPVSKPATELEVSVRREGRGDGQPSAQAKTVARDAAQDIVASKKPKRALFSIQQEEDPSQIRFPAEPYEPMLAREGSTYLSEEAVSLAPTQPTIPKVAVNPNSLEATADDLALTPAQRRQLFGRKSGKDANVMRFDIDSEYAANEQIRQAGDVVEHRQVKAIAPGKHSLQQLVNNARTQQDAMEDKWAEGRRNQGGSQYGWRG